VLVVATAIATAGCGGGSNSTTTTRSTPANRATPASVPPGKTIFAGNGCGQCHTLAEAGANGKVGPNLDTALKGKSAAFIRQSIADPDAVIAKRYPAHIMPRGFADRLGPAKLDALVRYLKSTAANK
jgi:mono/diheme cytochrome c family protein